jgi:hypothetical protein
MKSKHRLILDVFILLVWILSAGWYLGAFRGFPKGLDAYQHLTMTKFILEDWPNIRWYPNWYGGTPFYLWYTPLPHHLNALLVKVTTLPVETAIMSWAVVSLFMISIGLYSFVYHSTEDHDASLIVSLIVTSSPMWGFLVGGGAYARVMAVAFLPISALFTLLYIKNLQSKAKARKYYVGTVFATAAAIISHMQAGLLAATIVALLLVFCVEGRKSKILLLSKVFIPIFLLSSFFLLPFFSSGPTQFIGEIHVWNVPVPLSDIFLTYPGNWNTVSALILPIGIIAILVVRHRKTQFDRFTMGILKALIAIAALLFVYTFTRIPPEVYIFSPYDCPFYLTLFLAPVTGIILGRIFSSYGQTRKRRLITTSLLSLILMAAVFQLPILQSFVNDTGAQSWYSGYYATQNLIKVDPSDSDYRFGSDWDGASTWFNYWYDVPQTRGFYPLGIINKDWYDWFENAVWKEKDNYEETNFLLNWYAVKSLAVAWPYYNYQKFLDKPEFYDVISKIDTPTLYTMYQFDYKQASPITYPTDAKTLLVIGGKQAYDGVFRALAYANFNDAHVIPIRGQDYFDDYLEAELSKFDLVFLPLDGTYYRSYEKAWELLNQYVKNGGGLIIDTGEAEISNIPEPSPVEETRKLDLQGRDWNFTVADHQTTKWVDFLSFSAPQSISYCNQSKIRSEAKVVLWSGNRPVSIAREYEAGRVLWSGLNIMKRSADKNFMEALFLAKTIEWAAKTSGSISSIVDTVDSLNDWSIAWATGTNASVRLDNSTVKVGDSSVRLGYNFSDPIHRDEAVYLFDLPGIQNWSSEEFFSLWIFGDGSNNEFTIYLEGNDSRDSYWSTIRLDWKGWKQTAFWFNQMNKYGFADVSSINKLEIRINDDPYDNATSSCINIDGMYTGARYWPVNQLKSTVERSDPQRIVIKLDMKAKGILLKENCFDRWHAYAIGSNGSVTELGIQKAGPDFMYVLLPEGDILPAEIVFEYQMNKIDLTSYAVSLVTLVALVFYAFMPSLQQLARVVVRRFK